MAAPINAYQTTPVGSQTDGDSLLVTGQGIIAYDGDPAIFMSGDNQTTTIFGEVYSTTGRAILSQGDNAKVYVATGANVSGATGIQTGASASVTNAGTIQASNGDAVYITSGTLSNTGTIIGGVGFSGQASFANYGSIYGTTQAGDSTTAFSGYNSGHMNGLDSRASTTTFVNHGTIDSFYSENALNLDNDGTIAGLRFDDGSGHIVNHGTIMGDGPGDDRVFFSSQDDYYDGRDGILIGMIEGNGGSDTMLGGAQSDVFDGRDYGAAGADKLYGYGGDDTLYGDTGDMLAGGIGDDTYNVSTTGVTIVEAAGAGIDTVDSSVNFTLSANLENLSLADSLATRATGNTLANTLTGNAGKNVLDGGAGADVMIGLAGNDTYMVDNAGDQVIEAKGGGTDRVLASMSYTLQQGQAIETLQTSDASSKKVINLTGNEIANQITGNSGSNVLDGGLGADVLTGLGGNDAFVFDTKLGGGNIDHITDFSSGHDRIELDNSIFKALGAGNLAASAFKNLSSGTTDTSDRILYDGGSGKLYYDADGSGVGNAIQFAVLDHKPTITAADFTVV